MKKILGKLFKYVCALSIVVLSYGMNDVFAQENKSLILSGNNTTCNVYAKADGKQVLTYINPLYQRDVPLIADTNANSKYYKIMVSGVEGWISKTGSCFNGYGAKVRNVSAIPNYSFTTGSKKLSGLDVSRYQVVGNKMYFALVYGSGYITYNIGYTDVPKGLSNNKIYYSYDGVYYYANYSKMVTDYKNKTRKNATNASNPYYDYYQYVPIRSVSKVSPAALNKWLVSKEAKASKSFKENKSFNLCGKGTYQSKYNGYYSNVYNTGSTFTGQQKNYTVNAGALYGIMLNESANGTSNLSRHYNNPFGWGAYDSCPNSATRYATMTSAIKKYYSNMSSSYANPIAATGGQGTHLGNKKAGANVKYASDPHWGYKNAYNYRKIDELSGNVDKNRYQLGVINSGKTAVDGTLANEYTKVYASASTSAKSPYYYEKNGSTVIIQGTSGSFYKIQKDSSANAGSVYIQKSKVKLINSVTAPKTKTTKIEYAKSGNVHYIWGKNNFGQLGNGNTKTVAKANKINLNTLLPKGEVIKSVVKYNNTNIYVLTKSGNVYSSGSNSHGQRSYTSKANKFTKVSPPKNKISAIKISGNRLRMQRAANKLEYFYVGKNGFNVNTTEYSKTTKYPIKVRFSKNGVAQKAYVYNYKIAKVSAVYSYSKGKVKAKAVYTYNSKKQKTKTTYTKYNASKKKTYKAVKSYKNNVVTLKKEYFYVNNKLKSTAKKKAIYYKTTYSKGKAKKTYRYYYNTKGKLLNAVKIKTRK